MKYFLDTEFVESPCTIDLISIGIVDESGREFYAVSREFNLNRAWKHDFVRNNVLKGIYTDTYSGDVRNRFQFTRGNIKSMIKKIGLPRAEIAKQILLFIAGVDWQGPVEEVTLRYIIGTRDDIEFYGYFADYDWVAFCWLFGPMVDLPKGFPWYCIDLKQMMKERGLSNKWKKKVCPDPNGEHNAVVDARWNKKLYENIMYETKK